MIKKTTNDLEQLSHLDAIRGRAEERSKAYLSGTLSSIAGPDEVVRRVGKLPHKKIAIVYDWLDKWGGVERVLLHLAKMYPEAEFYTSYYNPLTASWAKNLTIHTSFMQRFPAFIKKSRWLSALFFPYAFESFDFTGFDLVISVTSSYGKCVITRPEAKHICYLLTPTRFLWSDHTSRHKLGIFNTLLSPYFAYLKKWDYITARRPDKYIVISKTVQKRLEEFYDLDGEVIYPPFDTEYWNSIKLQATRNKKQKNEFYLVVSRLEPYKNVDLIINAFNKVPDKKLTIIGTGSQEQNLKNSANKNITFVKNITDSQLAQYYQDARALVMMQEEDFGYTALEAQYFGCPVIAYKKGGATETVIDGKTGLLIDDISVTNIILTIDKFDKIAYNFKANMNKHLARLFTKYSVSNFEKSFKSATNR